LEVEIEFYCIVVLNIKNVKGGIVFPSACSYTKISCEEAALI